MCPKTPCIGVVCEDGAELRGIPFYISKRCQCKLELQVLDIFEMFKRGKSLCGGWDLYVRHPPRCDSTNYTGNLKSDGKSDYRGVSSLSMNAAFPSFPCITQEGKHH